MDYKEKVVALLNSQELSKEQKKKLEEIFPELAESEDEKIRKSLIILLQHFCKGYRVPGLDFPVSYKDMLAWLEKQSNSMGISEATKKELEDKLHKALEKETPGSWNKFLDEQKPADKVIEEEKPLLEKFKQAVYDCAWGKVTCKVEGESQEEYANRWAEHLLILVRDWADDYIDFTIQQKLRKSYNKGKENAIKENRSSWSEEDEEMWLDAIKYLELFDAQGIHENKAVPCINWLKSLKDRYTWKPSDEQMEALVSAIDVMIDNRGAGDKNTILLSGLYHKLKELREE